MPIYRIRCPGQPPELLSADSVRVQVFTPSCAAPPLVIGIPRKIVLRRVPRNVVVEEAGQNLPIDEPTWTVR